MAGATIANEIRSIASGLAGKRIDAIQVKDLMIDTSAGRKAKGRVKSKARAELDGNDRSCAESYYRAWKRSLETKLKDAAAGATESKANKPSPSPSPKAITKRSRRSQL